MDTQISQFCEQEIAIIDHNGQKWLTAEQLGLALGYPSSNARKGISALYNRHADEFSEEDSTIAVLTTVDNKQREVRIFSLSGCNLISFFANTPRAKEFRAWAKIQLSQIQQSTEPSPNDVLNSLNANMAQLAQGMNMVLTQNQMVHKYIALLEMNQKNKRRIVPEDAIMVKQLRDEGMTFSDIATTLRISKTSAQRLYNNTYTFSNAPLPPTIDQALENMVRREEEKVREMLGLLPENGKGE
ncbi:MAG: Bro-N domain-containing protein [Alysiella sp.]|uniref:BRO-N domain-containing protein n=1 Tax=Alysiella sp. TaxID=1872483 RepID=UPI0026DD5857|nr:Bro-N domain-containing protein [Alysiella sp.]MDO4434672.1 Bro-N domain-containing protein [Alysiella sp.]